MKVYFYRAECGDAARIYYRGVDGKFHNIFIDSGYERTFDLVLHEEIEKIQSRGELIDLWVISHIHDDHIGGVMAYLGAVKAGSLPDIVQNWFYNPPRITAVRINSSQHSIAGTLSSIKQGDQLTEYLINNKKVPSLDITDKSPARNLCGLTLYFLAPQPVQLRKLRTKYAAGKVRSLERIEPEIPDALRAFD